jgi:signal transduction histidine kinase/ActR/RegA family two-component response regulator
MMAGLNLILPMSSYAQNEPSARTTSPEILAEQLKAANYFLRIALDQMVEGVMILQSNGLDGLGPKILFGNATMAKLVGVDPVNGLTDRYVTQLVATQREAAGLLQALRSSAQGGGVALWEGELVRLQASRIQRAMWRISAVQQQSGQVVNYTVYVTPVEDAVGQGGEISQPAQTSFLPSSDEQDALDARRMRTENLATMAKGIVHDINNLLGIISGHLSVAATQISEQSEVGQHINEALAASHRARLFTGQILRMSRDLPEKRESADVAAIIRETARVTQSGSGVLIHLNIARDLSSSVVDTVKISQVFQNVILNGIQAMRGAGHMDIVARNVDLAQPNGRLAPGKYLEVSIRDRGCGIPEENLHRIFEDHFTTKKDGNGIGLTTCKRFVEEHQGDIRVSSMVNIGTEFAIYLPATDSKPQTVERKPQTAIQMGSGTVLVVDDETGLRRITSAILKRCGYRVHEVSTGEEAVRAYQQLCRNGGHVDAVVMDLTLRGGMDGEEAFTKIRTLDPDARVIASSGGLLEETRRSYLAAGFVDILPKPYEATDLAASVHRAMNGKSIPQRESMLEMA